MTTEAEEKLFRAAMWGELDQVRALIAEGVSLEARDGQERTALGTAALNGKVEIVRALLAAGADVNALDGERSTPLALAASGGHVEAAQALIESGADVDAPGPGTCPLWHAISGYRDPIVQLLLAAGASANAGLAMAISLGNTAVVTTLLEKGADPNGSGDAISPLSIAIKASRQEIALDLLARGARLSSLDLIVAIQEKLPRVVEALLAKGADPSSLDAYGKDSALTIAKKTKQKDVVEMLKKAGASR